MSVSESEDKKLVQLAMELSARFQIGEAVLEKVEWASGPVGWSAAFPMRSDQCYFGDGTIFLSERECVES